MGMDVDDGSYLLLGNLMSLFWLRPSRSNYVERSQCPLRRAPIFHLQTHSILDCAITHVPSHLGFPMIHVYMVEKSWTINQPYYKTPIKYITLKSSQHQNKHTSIKNVLRIHSYFYTRSNLYTFGKLVISSGKSKLSKLANIIFKQF